MDLKNKKVLIIGGIGIAVILIVLTVVLIVANNKKNTPGTDQTTGDEIQLEYWGLWEPSSVIEPIIAEYEAAHSNVKILYSQQTFTNYESRLYTRLQQSSSSTEPAPDIFRVHNTWTPKYYKYLTALPSDVMTSEDYASTFYPTATKDFTAKDGKIYAIPLEIDGLMVLYNKQLLKDAGVSAVPKDWDSFIELAQKLTKRNSAGKITQAGLAMGTSRNIRHASEIFSFLLLQEGIDIIDSTRTTVTLNTTKVESVLETYTNFAIGENAVWSSELPEDLEMFYSGKLAMMIAPTWRVFDVIQAAPTIEFDTATLPQLSANDSPIYYSTYWGEAVSKTCANPEAAWDFIQFLSEKEQQMSMYSNASKIRAFGEPYSLVSLNSEMKDKTYVSSLAEMAPSMVSWQMGDESFVKATINEAITQVVEENKSVQTVLKQAEQDINDQLAQTNK